MLVLASLIPVYFVILLCVLACFEDLHATKYHQLNAYQCFSGAVSGAGQHWFQALGTLWASSINEVKQALKQLVEVWNPPYPAGHSCLINGLKVNRSQAFCCTSHVWLSVSLCSAGCFEIKLVGLLIASVLLNTYTERLKAFVFFAPFRNLQRQQNANKQPFFSSGHAKPVKKLISIWVGSPGMSSPEKFRKIWKMFHYLICLKKEFEASLLFGLTMDKLSACLQREKTDIRWRLSKTNPTIGNEANWIFWGLPGSARAFGR